VLDTGGCDGPFNFTAPYVNAPKQQLPAGDGADAVELPQPCEDQTFKEPAFGIGARRGAAVLSDLAHVDRDRTLPNLLAALPGQTTPHTALSLSHSATEWAASLQNKAAFVIPHLTGSLQGVGVSSAQRDVVLDYVNSGGVVLVVGSPIRASSFLDTLFTVEIKDVRPDRGGISFLPGTDEITAPVGTTYATTCAATWSNQNSFVYVDSSSLPASARILYHVNDDHTKVAAFDFAPTEPGPSSGRVLYFAFDFYDAPNADTVCALRESVSRSMAGVPTA
jgi:hypothetical protein